MSTRSQAMTMALASGASIVALNSVADCFTGVRASSGTPPRLASTDRSLRGKSAQSATQEVSGGASIGPVGLLSAAALGLSVTAARPGSKKTKASKKSSGVARRVATVDVDVETANETPDSGPQSDELAGFGGGR
mmetsp:Transcript_90340/g.289652  ORF Transcript_90340/g.289652 Transcript_90340/m.289652 type:complete len:135 (-) Transcript_90340:140-544(-)